MLATCLQSSVSPAAVLLLPPLCHHGRLHPLRQCKLPDKAIYGTACQMLMAPPPLLYDMLRGCGILTDMSPEQKTRVRNAKSLGPQWLCSKLGLPDTNAERSEMPVFSLAAYNVYFKDTVFINLTHPPQCKDGFTGVRCSCQEQGLHTDCEHTYYMGNMSACMVMTMNETETHDCTTKNVSGALS